MTQWNDPQGRRPESWESQPTEYIPREQQPPQPQQPYYGAPGQPPRPNPFGAESNEAFGITGTVCALLGFVVLLVAFSALDWYHFPGSASESFSDITNPSASFADAWFSWLAWTFAIVGTVAAIASCFPSPAVRAFRIVGTVIGIAAAGLSFLAVQLSDQTGYVEYLKHARAGFYVSIAGFLLVAIGAAIGTRKV